MSYRGCVLPVRQQVMNKAQSNNTLPLSKWRIVSLYFTAQEICQLFIVAPSILENICSHEIHKTKRTLKIVSSSTHWHSILTSNKYFKWILFQKGRVENVICDLKQLLVDKDTTAFDTIHQLVVLTGVY